MMGIPLSGEKLIEIEQLAALLFSPREICVIAELDFTEVRDCFTDVNDSIYKSYQKGKLKTIAKEREIVVKLAMEGSSASQILVEKYIDELKTKEANEIS
ncbi:MAG: hypothetical protein KA954_11465 [Chitinophagales bacterium]|nr:hypothetical protein [Chitinophagales bacterium]MBP9704641.1 hypothetical protein [Chitinophagales bacterium]